MIAQRYEIGELIGQGGMGNVYKGVDTQTGETVAIKALKTEIVESNPDLLERFEREGEVLRKLNHPNIVKILATVEDEGRHYIMLEYVGGGSLRDWFDLDKPIPVRQVLEVALDLADALTRTHRLKIIHRDIKPANVLLAEDDAAPRLTDFGVAAVQDRTRMTETGALVGTFAYLSPEACRGEIPDERTNIWSFGVTLYELLTGVHPFKKFQPVATINAIANDPLPALTDYRTDVPAALADLIAQMLEKDRQKRIASIRRVGAELESILLDMEQKPAAKPDAIEAQGEAKAGGQKSRFATPTSEIDQSKTVPDTDTEMISAEILPVPPKPSWLPAHPEKPKPPQLFEGMDESIVMGEPVEDMALEAERSLTEAEKIVRDMEKEGALFIKREIDGLERIKVGPIKIAKAQDGSEFVDVGFVKVVKTAEGKEHVDIRMPDLSKLPEKVAKLIKSSGATGQALMEARKKKMADPEACCDDTPLLGAVIAPVQLAPGLVIGMAITLLLAIIACLMLMQMIF